MRVLSLVLEALVCRCSEPFLIPVHARASVWSAGRALITTLAAEPVFLGVALILLLVLVRDCLNVS